MNLLCPVCGENYMAYGEKMCEECKKKNAYEEEELEEDEDKEDDEVEVEKEEEDDAKEKACEAEEEIEESEEDTLIEALKAVLEAVKEANVRSAQVMEDFQALKEEYAKLIAEKVIKEFGKVDFLINNAKPKTVGLTKGTFEDFEYALSVGVTAPFYLTKLFKDYFTKEACIIKKPRP